MNTKKMNAARWINHDATVMAIGGLLAAAGMATPALAVDWSWNTGNGVWSNAANWLPCLRHGRG